MLVHVTHWNRVLWDAGSTPTRVIEHGVVDPGPRATGELARASAVINEPVRRGRVTGTDILVDLARRHPIDLFGMRSEVLGGRDLPQAALHDEMARRRVYLHPNRWTSLGLSLIEAMHLALPVVCLAMTEAPAAVPAGAGVVSNDLAALEAGLARLLVDPELAAACGQVARAAALERYGLARFLADWDALLADVADRLAARERRPRGAVASG